MTMTAFIYPRPRCIMFQVKLTNLILYKFEQDISVIKAITIAGGFSKIAARGKVNIIRTVNGKKQVFKNVDMDDPILPNDVIVVPESFF